MTTIKLKRGTAVNLPATTLVAGEAFVLTDTQEMGFSPDGTDKILLISKKEAKKVALLYASSF
jgi:hypothetical protein